MFLSNSNNFYTLNGFKYANLILITLVYKNKFLV